MKPKLQTLFAAIVLVLAIGCVKTCHAQSFQAPPKTAQLSAYSKNTAIRKVQRLDRQFRKHILHKQTRKRMRMEMRTKPLTPHFGRPDHLRKPQ